MFNLKNRHKRIEPTTMEQPLEVPEEPKEPEEPKPVRAVIDGILYDTSKATKIYSINYCDHNIDIYKGKSRYFTVKDRDLVEPVDEDWVKSRVIYISLELYIELFGEPELA